MLSEVEVLPSLLHSFTRRKSISKLIAKGLKSRLDASIILFENFKTEEGDAYEDEDPTASAELDSMIISITTIRDGIATQLDELGDGEVVGPVPTAPVTKTEDAPVPLPMRIIAARAAARDIKATEGIAQPPRKFSEVNMSIVEQGVRDMQPDEFAAFVVSLISGHMEYE